MDLRRAAQQTSEVIVIDDDHDIDFRGIDTRARVEAREATNDHHEDSVSTSTSIDLTEDGGLDEEHEDSVNTFMLIDLTEDDDLDGQDYLREATPCSCRDNSPDVIYAYRQDAYRQVNSVESLAGTLNIGECYELTDGDFLLVKQIIERPAKRETSLRRTLLRRDRRVYDMLPKRTNEVCMMMKAASNTKNQPSIEDCLVSRPLDAVLTRRMLTCTNRPFQDRSFRGVEPHPYLETAAKLGVLVCRWKHVEFYDARDGIVQEEMLSRLNEAEGDRARVIADVMLSRMWQKEEPSVDTSKNERKRKNENKRKNEKRRKNTDATATVLVSDNDDEDNDQEVIGERHDRHKVYSYGDICAGAGGVATGAVQAGLKLNFLLDHWHDACETLKRMPGHCHSDQILCADIHDFCTGKIGLGLADRLFRVEILHISFPCQPHSASHTIPGKDDDANIAAPYSVIPILQKCKPRIVTFEQMSGIITHGDGSHFRALIHQLTVAGYSARWRIVNLAQYGNVQARKRLIVIAAGPGEVLPPFPSPTHGPQGSGLKPFTTVEDILAKVPERDPSHMLAHSVRPHISPYNARQPLRLAITCNGGKGDVHPDGTRSFTMRELSMLQGFPPTHEFFGKMMSIRRQCGNAVPSCFAKLLFEEIKGSLSKRDGEVADWKPEIIELD
ncbi:hypothetical protein KC357_g8408 [Hortaea werneckii]|nr:hypothetical protein KC357_g8408 [Hortaea werneckii]